MTPGARVAAAIEVLDAVLAGQTAERALSAWGRSHRFAGSKDRAAIRDHVFQALRCRASYAWLGGAETGYGIMLGAARAAGMEAELFTGEGHAPRAATRSDGGQPLDAAPRHVRLDVPEWMLPHFSQAFGPECDGVLETMRERAGVFLRVNLARGSREEAQAKLAGEGIRTVVLTDVKTALQVTENERKVSQSSVFQDGFVELQDPSSQRAVLGLDLVPGQTVLDYCAGGGGKSLALADRGARVTAHDIDEGRMVDLPRRAARAGVRIDLQPTRNLPNLAPFDAVFVDAPCSGSGTWRRSPEAKWALTDNRLIQLGEMQRDALEKGLQYVAPTGQLVYATCSVFELENRAVVEDVIGSTPGFTVVRDESIWPTSQGDGFYFCVIRRAA